MTLMNDNTALRQAASVDRDQLNRTLTAAFLDDPVMEWVFPTRGERAAALPEMFDAFADAFRRHDQTHVVTEDGAVTGVAMWAPPGVAPIDSADEEVFSSRVAELSGEHIERAMTCMKIFEAAHPAEPAWYLQFLGVDPERQSRGFGSLLLRQVLSAADGTGAAAYLEATSPRNRDLYERHGFVTVADLALPEGPTAYAMWREPQV
jgi:ribosomal protein S18 acetylase RimI-like enzyme